MNWYKWAFDGVGGAVLLALCSFIYRRLTQNRTRVSSGLAQIAVRDSLPLVIQEHHYHSTTLSAFERKNSDPTPLQIWKEINSALPYDRDHAGKKYNGLEVLWHLRLQSVSKLESKWFVHTLFEPNSAGEESRYCSITWRLSTVPVNLKTAPQETLLWIQGRIGNIEGHISLEDDPTILAVERNSTP